MLFKHNIEPSCAYCKCGVSLGFGEVVCRKRGIMSEDGNCNAFCYEPTKRKPEYAKTIDIIEISEEDMRI